MSFLNSMLQIGENVRHLKQTQGSLPCKKCKHSMARIGEKRKAKHIPFFFCFWLLYVLYSGIGKSELEAWQMSLAMRRAFTQSIRIRRTVSIVGAFRAHSQPILILGGDR